MNQEKEVSAYMVLRYDIINGNFKPLLSKLKNNKSPLEAPFHIIVDGYNEDPRELYQIPEVRRYFKALTKRFKGWLSPFISIDTIKLVVQILLSKKTERAQEPLSDSMRHIYIKESEWVELISKWARNSPLGQDYGAHLAFEAFPSMLKRDDFIPKTPSLLLLKNMVETGYVFSQAMMVKRQGALKVYSINEDEMHICLYYKFKTVFEIKTKVFSIPDLESEESVMNFKLSLEEWVKNSTNN